MADRNATLLLAMAQGIDPRHTRALDLDHIYPSDLAKHMRIGQRHHADRWRVNSVGNLWLLDARVNRSLQATPPEEKFERLREWRDREGANYPVWQDDQWALTPEEQMEFRAAASALGELPVGPDLRAPALDAAMRRFTTAVHSRTQNLLQQALDDLPDTLQFARQPEDSVHGIGDVEEVEAPEARTVDGKIITGAQERLGISPAGAHSLADLWRDRSKEVESAFKEATRWQSRRTEPGRRNAPRIWRDSVPGASGFAYFRELPFGFAEHTSYFRVGYSEWFDPSALLWFLIAPNQPAQAGACEALRGAALTCTSDERGVRVPIRLEFYLSWGDLARDIDRQISDARRALGDSAADPG